MDTQKERQRDDRLRTMAAPLFPPPTSSSLDAFLVKYGEHPEEFLVPSAEVVPSVTTVLKSLFDASKTHESERMPDTPLQQLAVDGLDTEQIWQEVVIA